MGSAMALLVVLVFVCGAVMTPTVESFNCNSTGVTCNGLVGYIPPNATTVSNIATLFGIQDNLPSLLGANNLSLSTPASQTVPANKTINIPFPCLCSNGTGRPKDPPVYTVVKDDGLYHIAAEVFSRLVTDIEIQAFNKIPDINLIKVGQELKIPLPCSCDEVGGERVVHYGYVVEYGSSVQEIAQKFNTSEQTLMQINGLTSAKDLKGGVAIDVPLKACTSKVEKNSLDYPLLLSGGTYAFTAGDCVMCSCNTASNDSALYCQPSPSQAVNSTIWKTCPSMQCQAGGGSLYLGNSTSSSGGCNITTCAYAGYNRTNILTTLSSANTCSDNNKNSATKLSWKGWSWSCPLVAVFMSLFVLV